MSNEYDAIVSGLAQEAPSEPQEPREINNREEGYDDIVSDFKTDKIRSSLRVNQSISQDEAIGANKLARQYGAPLDVVQRNRQDYESRAALDAVNVNEIEKGAPVLAKTLSDPRKAPLVKDDIDNMFLIERVARDFSQSLTIGNNTRRLANLTEKDILGTITPSERLEAQRIKDYQAKEFNVPHGLDIPAVMAESLPLMVQNTLRGARTAAAYGTAAAGLALFGGQLGPQVATPEEVVTVPAAFTGATAVAFPYALGAETIRSETALAFSEYQDFIDEDGNKISRDVAMPAAALSGITSGLLESYGLGKVIEQFPWGKQIMGRLSREGVQDLMRTKEGREILKRFGSSVGITALAEGSTEALQELSQIMFGELAKASAEAQGRGNFSAFEEYGIDEQGNIQDENMFWSTVLNRVSEAGVEGAKGGAGYGFTGASVTTAAEMIRDNQVGQKSRQIIERLKESTIKSKVFVKDPQTWEELTQDTLGKNDIYLDAEDVKTFFQSNFESEEQGLAAMSEIVPDIQERLSEALEQGGEVILPANKFARAISEKQELAGLSDIAKTDPQALYDEAMREQYFTRILPEFGLTAEELEAAGQNEASGEALQRRLAGEFQDAGYTPEVASKYAGFARSFYDTQRSRGENSQAILDTLEDMFSRLRIRDGSAPFETIKKKGDFEFDDLFYDRARALATGTKAPAKDTRQSLLDFLVEQGGVRADEQLYQELVNLDIDRAENGKRKPKAKRLLQEDDKSGQYLDDLALAAFEQGYFPESQERPDLSTFLEAIEEETRGQPRYGNQEIDAEISRDLSALDFLEQIDRLGLDITTADNKQIRSAIEAAQRDYTRGEIEATFNQPANINVNPDELVNIVDLSKIAGLPKKQTDVKNFLRDLITQQSEFTTADQKRIMKILPKNVKHISFARNKNSTALSVWKKSVVNLPKLLESAVLIESVPNKKRASKSYAAAYHRFYVPVKSGSKVYTMRLVAEQSKEGLRLDANAFDLYEIIPEKNPLPSKPVQGEPSSLFKGKGDKITIAQMLENVKDTKGHSYFQSDIDDPDYNKKRAGKKNRKMFYEPKPRGAITLPNATNPDYVISLFEGRDLSTALHEMGHFFLEVQRSISEHPEASEQTKADWQKTLKWLGVEKSEDIGRDQHEKFARGMEAYVFEGKAPSLELREMFQRFKAWMVRIYKEVKYLKAPVSEEMKEVFERMLATDEQIEALKTDATMRLDPNVSFLLNKQQREAYERQVNQAAEQAKEELLLKLLKEKERENSAWWKEQYEQTEKQVRAEVQKSRDFRAYEYIKNGVVFDDNGQQTDTKLDAHKLDQKALKEIYGVEILRKLPAGLTVNAGGVHPSVAADIFGYSGVDHMIRSFANLPDFKKTIARVSHYRMVREHGDMLNDGTIEREAMSLMHNDAKADLISRELQIVAKQAAEQVPSKEAFKKRARQVLSSKQIEKIRPSNYYYAEIKNARLAGEALTRKDYKKYAEYKGRQLFNHYLYREASEAREYVDNSLKRFNDISKRPARNKVKIDEDYRQRIVDILDKYNLGSRISNARRTRMEMRAFNNWIIEKRMNDNAQLILPEELIEADSKTHYRDLTLEEFRALRDVVDNLETQGRRKNQIIVNGRRADLQEAVDDVTRSIAENNKIRDIPIQTRTKAENLKHQVNNFFMNTIKARTLIRQMDGFKDLGPASTYLMAPIDEAEAIKANRMRRVTEEVEALFNRHYGKGLQGIASKKSAIYSRALGGSIQKDGLLAIALNWGNIDNRQKMIDGLARHHNRALDENQLKKLLEENLTKSDWDFVQETWQYIDSFWPEIESLEKKRAGIAPEKVEGEDFTIRTKDGEELNISGGYYPIKYDERKSASVGANEQEDIAQLMRAGRFSRAQTKRGHTKERAGSAEYPIRLDLGVIFQHLNEVVTDITMSEAIDTTYKVLSHKETKEYISEFFGKNVYDQLEIWLKDVAVGSVSKASAFDGIADNIRAGLSVSVMGFKVSTSLIQITGYTQSIVRLGPANMLKGFTMLLGNGRPEQINKNVQMAFAKSKILEDRSVTFHRDIYDTMRIMQNDGKIKTKIAQAAFWPIVKMQMLVDVPTWMAAYQKGLKQFDGDDDKAIRFADEQLIMAQSSGLFKDLSGFERGSISAQTRLSPVIRLWTSFYSFFNAKLNLAYERTKDTNFKKPRDVARLASDYLLLFWVEAVIGEMILQRAPDFEDEEDSALWWNVKLAMSNMAATIPFMREISSGLSGFDSAPAGLRGLDEVVNSIRTVKGVVEDAFDPDEDVNMYQATRNLNSAGGILFKYPSAQLNQAIRAMEEVEKGEDVAPIDYLLFRPNK